MPGIHTMVSPRDLDYMLHVTDEAFMMHSIPIIIKKVDPSCLSDKDDLMEEVLRKRWIKSRMHAIVVNRPDPKLLDRFATRTPIKIIVSVSKLSVDRAENIDDPSIKGWDIDPEDIIEYPDADGTVVDYYIDTAIHDGEFIDTDGRITPLSYTILLSDEKAPTP